MLPRLLPVLLIAVNLSACASLLAPKVEQEVAALKPGSYTLDKSHATLLFKVQHLGLSTYVGRFNGLEASLEFDPEKLLATQLTARIDMRSVDVNNEGLEKDLQGSQWFQTRRYPTAEFRTLSVRPLSDTEFAFTGELDWRGVVKPIELQVLFHGGANNLLTGKYTLGFSATGSFSRSEFGMDAFTPLVGDQIKLEAFAEFQKN